jgi:transmembrane 9 superfamily protein 2/4
MLLSMMVGNGAQLCAMLGITLGQKHFFGTTQLTNGVKRLLVFALFGFLSPSNRGSLATVMIVCWTFFGGCVECRVPATLL